MTATSATLAHRLHDQGLVWDAHMDTLQGAVADGVDLAFPSRWHDLSQWRLGSIRAQVFAIWVDPIYGPPHATRRALQQVDAFYTLCERHPDLIEPARTGADVRRIARVGKLAGLLALEGGLALQNDLGLLRTFHRLGVSSMTLTHSNSLDWVDSSTDRPLANGLSALGGDIIREMNRLGMVVDVSHCSDQAVRDVLAVSIVPIIASHSSAHALCPHPRNLSDELLRAIATKGGVIGVNFYAAFLSEATWRATLAVRGDSFTELNRPPTISPEELDREAAHRARWLFKADVDPPPLDCLIDHVLHILDVAGEDHVGFGSDLGSMGLPLPAGISSPADFPKVTAGLLDRGVPERVVEKVMGRNFLRVWETITRS